MTVMQARIRLGLLLFSSLISSVSLAQEESDASRTLSRDFARIVALQEQTGWGVDRYEFETMIPVALRSLCRVPSQLWPVTEAALESEVQRLGGDPAARYEEADRDLDRIEELLSAWRTRELFTRALEQAAECPFWMSQDASFRGLHADEGRWSVHLEGGGLFVGRISDGEVRFGAGGGGRLTAGYGFSESWDLRMGLGFGGAALADSSVQTENIAVDFFMDAPVIVRHGGILWRQEIEFAPIISGIPWLGPLQYGVRVGGLIGVGYLRVREVMPWAGLGLYGEYLFERAGLSDAWTVRVGVRVGFSWSSLSD